MKKTWILTMSLMMAATWISGAAARTAEAGNPEGGLEVVRAVTPQIPEGILSIERAERVIVELMVMPDGSVQQAKVICTHNTELSPYVIDAVRQWKFTPKLVKGEAVAARVHLPIEFRPAEAGGEVNMTIVARR